MNPQILSPLSHATDDRPPRALIRNLLPLAFTLAVLALLGFTASARAATSSPIITNVQMSQIAAFSAEVAATIDPGDHDVYYFAEYDLQTPPEGEGTSGWLTQTQKLAAGSGPTPVGIILPNLSSGTAYTVHIRAVNVDGSGEVVDSASIPFSSVTLGLNGVAITDFRAFDVSTNYAEISGTSHTADGIGNSSCTVDYIAQADYDAGATDPYSGGSSMPCNPPSLAQNVDGSMVGAWIWGLSPGTAYDYRYVVTNDKGTWTSDDQTFMTLPLAPSVSAPVPSQIGIASATMAAAVTTGNGAMTCKAQIVSAAVADAHLADPFGDATSVDCEPATVDPGTGGSQVSAAFTGLEPNTAYRVRFAVANASASVVGTDTRFTTAALAPTVADAQVTDLSDSTASIKAAVDPNGVATSVYVRYWTPGHVDASGTVAVPAGSSGQTVTVELKGLAPATDYSYKVVALSSAGTTETPEQTFRTLATPPPAIPGAPSITSGPAKETFDTVAAFFFVGDGTGFVCSVDGSAWTPCSSGDDFGPVAPGNHTFAVRALGVGGLQSDPASYPWTVVDPNSCVVTKARARLYLNPTASKVRLVLSYKSSKRALVSVDFATAKGKVRQRIGRATAKFKTNGVYRLPRRVSKATMARLLNAKRFNVQLAVHGEVPGLCSRYFSRDLTVRKRVGGQIVVFQKGSAFGPGPLTTSTDS